MRVLRPVLDPFVELLQYVNRQKWKYLAGLVVTALVVAFSFGSSVFLYLVVNQMLLPRIHSEAEVVFGPPVPPATIRWANFSVDPFLSRNVRYSFDLVLHWPETDLNMVGEKTVGLLLSSASVNGTVLLDRVRSVLIQYKSWHRLVIERLFWAVPFALGLVSESQTTRVSLVRDFFNPGAKWAAVQLDATAQIYSASVSIHAGLEGISYYWYHWRLTTLVCFVGSVWLAQLCSVFVLAVVVLARLHFFRRVDDAPLERADFVAYEEVLQPADETLEEEEERQVAEAPEPSNTIIPPADGPIATSTLVRQQNELKQRRKKKK